MIDGSLVASRMSRKAPLPYFKKVAKASTAASPLATRRAAIDLEVLTRSLNAPTSAVAGSKVVVFRRFLGWDDRILVPQPIEVLSFFPISRQNSVGHLDVHLDDSVLFSSFFIALSANAASLYK